MTEPNALFAQEMKELRRKYIMQLTHTLQEFKDFLQKIESGEIKPEYHQAIRESAHKLTGSGKTYGFAKISEAGHELENATTANQEAKTIADKIRQLIIATEEAIKENPDTNNIEVTVKEPDKANMLKKKPVILIADDDTAILDMLKQMLHDSARVISTANGRKALEMIKRSKPDIAILDDSMPELTGVEILEELKKSGDHANMQVIMLTANNRKSNVVRALSAGAVDYVTKPFDYKSLSARIHGLINKIMYYILIADDDETVRAMLAHHFNAAGLHTLQAANGDEALKLIKEYKPELAILDRMMPGMDVLTVMQEIRDDKTVKDTPFLFLTANKRDKDVFEGMRMGVDDYIIKPFNPEDVVARAIRLINRDDK